MAKIRKAKLQNLKHRCQTIGLKPQQLAQHLASANGPKQHQHWWQSELSIVGPSQNPQTPGSSFPAPKHQRRISTAGCIRQWSEKPPKSKIAATSSCSPRHQESYKKH